MALSEKQIAELKEKYGQVLTLVETPDSDVVFRKPTRTEFDRWFDKNASDKAKGTEHARQLVKSCLVFPTEETFNNIIDKTPALVPCEFLQACTGMAGLQETFKIQKL
jgi:hypothetical protein